MKRAFSGAKQPMNNEKSGKIRPPNLYLYLNLIPYLKEAVNYSLKWQIRSRDKKIN
jgi:hypothetical protein